MRKRDTLSELLRNAIGTDARTYSELAEEAGCTRGQLSRFMAYERSLTLPTVEGLLRALGLQCKLTQPRARKGR